ncbi:MAG: thioesterase family protein [Cyclobacteriaceae bacterium]
MDSFSKKFDIIWADLDPNDHMRHTAYNDYAAQVRVSFFEEKAMPLDKLKTMGVGPILFREETLFFKEIRMSETIRVEFQVGQTRKDGSKWRFVQNVFNEQEELAAIITVEGAWLDLNKRKVTVPPAEIAKSLITAPRTEDFKWIPDKAT